MTNSLIETVSNSWMPFNWGNPFDKQFINACLCLCGHHSQGWDVAQTSALSMTWVTESNMMVYLSWVMILAVRVKMSREKNKDHAS